MTLDYTEREHRRAITDAIANTGAAVPEPTWKFRRLAVYGGLIASMLIIAFIVARLAMIGDVKALETIATLLIAKQLILYMIYLVAPSVEYVGKVTELIRSVRP